MHHDTIACTEKERILALKMLREVLESLVPSIPKQIENPDLIRFMLTPDILAVMQDSIAKGRGVRPSPETSQSPSA